MTIRNPGGPDPLNGFNYVTCENCGLASDPRQNALDGFKILTCRDDHLLIVVLARGGTF